jgi:hypothetical protein
VVASGNEQARQRSTLPGTRARPAAAAPDAGAQPEAQAELLLETMEARDAIRQLMNEGYRQAMEESAVATTAARQRALRGAS